MTSTAQTTMDLKVAVAAIKEQYAKHLPGHEEEWLELQMKRARSYAIYGSDVEPCAVCVAYGTALKGLEDARNGEAEAEA